MMIRDIQLESVAVTPSQYPSDHLPEIAFVGRSNVGKSSLINKLVNRKALARTSSKPGKTRTINFYRVNDEMRLVDLPGYGFAHVSAKEQDAWAEMINHYLLERENLRQVVQLVDLRHEPTKLDVQMYEWLVHAGFNGIVVATKADKIAKGKRDQHLSRISKDLKLKERGGLVMAFSAVEEEDGMRIWENLLPYLM